MSNHNNLPISNQPSVPATADSRKPSKSELKSMEERAKDIVKAARNTYSNKSRAYQLAVAKNELEKYLTNLNDEALIELRKKLYHPSFLIDSGKTLLSVLIVDILAIKFFEFGIAPHFSGMDTWKAILLGLVIYAVLLIVGTALLMCLLYKLNFAFESYNDNFDECKLELIDEILKKREEDYIDALNRSSNSTSNSQTP